jgi:hypothetical protein
MRAWSAIRVNNNFFASSLIFKVGSLRALLDCPISLFMLVLSWTWSHWNFHFRSNTKLLCFRIVAKLMWIIICARTTIRFRDHFIASCVVFPVPCRISLFYNTISFFMSILTWAWAKRNFDFRSYTKLLSL